VADENRESPRPFDVRTVEYLLELMSKHELSEVDLKEGDQRIRLRKGAAMPTGFLPAPVAYAQHAPQPAPPASSAAPSTSAPASPPPPPSRQYHEIKSELVGSFYTRPSPDKPEFVKVGSRVTPDTTVCLVIAMKVNNEIKAGCSGTIVEVVAKNEDFVDFGTVLFRVDPNG
jgi:acetyl-CoA carboxylase biotin carboxyl carrier protein